MAIGDRVDEAIVKLIGNDLENALIQISIAIDATAKKIFSNEKVGVRIKRFISSYEDLIIHFSTLGQLKIIAKDGISYGDKGDIGHLMYKSIRCALLHEGDISNSVVFRSGPIIGMHEGKFIVTDNMLWGLVLILIGDASNSKERLKQRHIVKCFGETLELNDLWGDLEQIKKLTKYIFPSEIVPQYFMNNKVK